MRLHERTQIVNRARIEVKEAVWAAVKAHDLTYGEVHSILGSIISDFAKYQIRDERHPGEDKKGDEE